MRHSTDCRGDGFTLVEVLVAMLLLAVLAGGVSVLVAGAAQSLARSRLDTLMAVLAQSRLDQLLGLPWGYGSASDPIPRSDVTTDLSPATPGSSGTGLAGGAIAANLTGFVDHLDQRGRWLGNGATAGAGARFTRRWQVRRAAGRPDVLVLRVRVIDLRGELPPLTIATLRTRTAS